MKSLLPRSGVLSLGLVLLLAACGSETPGESGSSAEDNPCASDEFGCVTVEAGQPIVLGTAFVISGPDADLGIDSQRGVEIAVNRRAEFLGHPLELDFQDDGCSAEGGTAVAQAFVSNPQIVAVIGTSCSSAGVPAAEILSENGILMVSPSTTAPSLTDPESHQPFFARTAHNDRIQGAAMAEFACDELGVDSAATLHDGSPYAEQLQEVFVAEFANICGGSTVVQEAVTVGQVDFSAVLTSIAAGTPPDFIYYPVFVAEGTLITQQVREHPRLGEALLGAADGIQSASFLEAAGEAAEGMFLSGPNFDFGGERYEEFLADYRELHGSDPVAVYHAHAFDATEMVLAAIEAVAIEDGERLLIPRTALRDALLATADFAGLTGSLTCDHNGDCADSTIGVVEVQNGAFVPVWP